MAIMHKNLFPVLGPFDEQDRKDPSFERVHILGRKRDKKKQTPRSQTVKSAREET
jgi:hypothetical protein